MASHASHSGKGEDMTSTEHQRAKGQAIKAARARRVREASEELLNIVKAYVTQNEPWANDCLGDAGQRLFDQARKLIRRIEDN